MEISFSASHNRPLNWFYFSLSTLFSFSWGRTSIQIQIYFFFEAFLRIQIYFRYILCIKNSGFMGLISVMLDKMQTSFFSFTLWNVCYISLEHKKHLKMFSHSWPVELCRPFFCDKISSVALIASWKTKLVGVLSGSELFYSTLRYCLLLYVPLLIIIWETGICEIEHYQTPQKPPAS